jgi:hypothetical protein
VRLVSALAERLAKLAGINASRGRQWLFATSALPRARLRSIFRVSTQE